MGRRRGYAKCRRRLLAEIRRIGLADEMLASCEQSIEAACRNHVRFELPGKPRPLPPPRPKPKPKTWW